MSADSNRSLAAHPEPRRISKRGVAIGLIGIVIFVVAYVLVVRAYQVEGDITTSPSASSSDASFLAVARPVDFDARTNTLTVRFLFDVTEPDLLDDGERLAEGIRVTIFAADGTHEVRFAKGEPIGNAELEIGTSGDVYAYPLDDHDGFMSMSVETFERGAGGVNETTGSIQGSLDVDGAVPGWDINARAINEEGFPFVLMDLRRAFSTKAFAVVLVGMAITVSVLAFIAAILTLTNRRRFEVALLTWNGALLFALPLLRNYLPGSPPIGAAIDIYVYLWVILFAVVSLVFMVIAWAEQRKADLVEERSKIAGA
jgi:hypothetical protein